MASGLRSIQATPMTAQPSAISQTAATYSGAFQLASTVSPVLTGAIAAGVAAGVPADMANEAAAAGLDQAAAKLSAPK